MLLPLNDGSWKDHERGDRVVHQIDFQVVAYALVTSKFGCWTLKARRLLAPDDKQGVGPVFSLGPHEVTGYVGHPQLIVLLKDDLIWVEALNLDGTTRNDGYRFALVSSVGNHKIKIRRFDQRREVFAKQESDFNVNSEWIRIGNQGRESDRLKFTAMVKGTLSLPPQTRLRLPPPPETPQDPRDYVRKSVGLSISTISGRATTVGRFENSTKYPDSFLYHLRKIQSGEQHAVGFQSILTYWGLPDLRISGSELGEVRAYFLDGKPTDEDFQPLRTLISYSRS